MRWIISYIRSLFCTHEWEMIFNTRVTTDLGEEFSCKTYRCKKCGYSKKYRSI